MRFDTLDKKPKLYNVAALSAAVGVIIAVLLLTRGRTADLTVSSVLIVYFAAVIFMLIGAFFGQLRYNPYSYNTIFYSGFALFLLSVLGTQIAVHSSLIRYPESDELVMTVSVLTHSAMNYMLLTSPFILVFSAALFVSNIALIRHEGRRFVNLLGIILSALMVIVPLALFRFDYYATGSQFEVMMHDIVAYSFSAVYLYFECMIVGAMIADAIAARYEPEKDKDAIIILGCGIRKDGTPTPLLRGRIDRALGFARAQKAQGGKDVYFVTSGGQGPGEVISESACMKRYLVEQGVPEEMIIEEDRSTSTFENMKFSKERLAERGLLGPDAKIAFSTTNYHVFRGGLYARRVKMRAQGMGAKTRWWFWPNAAVREFVGLLTAHRLKQGLIFGGMLAFYVILTVVSYQFV